MSSPEPATARRVTARRPSVSVTVLRVAAIATTAAVLIWAALFVGVSLGRSDAGTALAPPSDEPAADDGAWPGQAPAPVETRSS
jgi:hypothetical protein